MGYKTTTDIYSLRARNTMTVASGAANTSSYAVIETGLDSINREVLLIWEVDFQGGSLGTQIGNIVGDPATASYNHQLSLLKEQENLTLDEVGCVAISQRSATSAPFTVGPGGKILSSDIEYSPETTTFASQVSMDAPLGIVVGPYVYFRQGLAIDSATVTADTIISGVRIMVQRAKADADTYAALLQGYAL